MLEKPLLGDCVSSDDESIEDLEACKIIATAQRKWPTTALGCLIARIIASSLLIVLLLWTLIHIAFPPAATCENGKSPTIRREWRTLVAAEQSSYFAALKCLRASRSKILLGSTNTSRYYDFAWVHYNTGDVAHDSAALLPWHRWFLILFERALRDECHYPGPMPYWDWTLDWQYPELSPIFDPRTGFGGNGNLSEPSAVTDDGGYCVTDGIFANSFIPAEPPFCLSRNFSQGTTFPGTHLSPTHIGSILHEKEYWAFLQALEAGPHDDIHMGINGTFFTLYAPADPILWLHHAQLDRIWWIWQRSRKANEKAYGGPSTSLSDAEATLDDGLSFGGITGDVHVRDVMSTEQKQLCYRYDKEDI